MSGSLPDESTNVKWMYEGKDSSIDREAYLLGKRITKVEEEKGDFIVEKKTNENLSVSVLEKLDYESKVREDPLFAIRNKESEKRRELLSNPIKRKHLQTTLKNALLKDLGSGSKHKKKRRSSSEGHHRKHRKRRSSSSSTSDSSLSSAEDVQSSKSKKILKSANKDKNLHAALKKALEKDLKKSNRAISSSSESDAETRHKNKKSKKHKKRVDNDQQRLREYSPPKHSKKKSRHDRSYTKMDESSEHTKTIKQESARHDKPKKDGYGLIVMGSHHSKPTSRRQRSPTPPPVKERYSRKEKSGFTKKLSKEDLERKRKEMMENADWRDEQRKKNVTHYNKKEELEVKKEAHIRNLHDDQLKKHGKVKTFLHDMKLKQVSHGSLEDTVKRKRHRMERASND